MCQKTLCGETFNEQTFCGETFCKCSEKKIHYGEKAKGSLEIMNYVTMSVPISRMNNYLRVSICERICFIGGTAYHLAQTRH